MSLSSLPKTYQSIRRTAKDGKTTLSFVTETTPTSLKPTEVLIQIHAVSLNYRDGAILSGYYPFPVLENGVPASDCAAEVVAVGTEVHDFIPGDHVAPMFDLANIEGHEDGMAALGGDVEGVLRKYAVFDQKVLYHLPKHLSWEEAAIVTCVGVSAWNALQMPRDKGTAVLQGTGSVSLFGLLLCLSAGIHPIVTSSSDHKLELVRKLGGAGEIDTINYDTNPKWEDEVLRLTNGRGADVVINIAGPKALPSCLTAVGRRGTISLVGFLGGFDVDTFPDTFTPIFSKTAVLRGIAVGRKQDYQDLSKYLSDNTVSLKSIIHSKTFSFEDAATAFDLLQKGSEEIGKIVIRL